MSRERIFDYDQSTHTVDAGAVYRYERGSDPIVDGQDALLLEKCRRLISQERICAWLENAKPEDLKRRYSRIISLPIKLPIWDWMEFVMARGLLIWATRIVTSTH